MKKFWGLCVSVVMIFSILAACSATTSKPESKSDSKGTTSEKSGPKKYAFVFKNTGNPYGEKMQDGFQKAIKEKGGELILRSPDQPTAEGQIQIIEQLINQK